MYISLNWISDFVDLTGISTDDIVSRMTLSTAEVEGFEVVTRFLDGVVVGKIVAAEQIVSDEGRRQHFCTVDVGGAEKFTTVCGAPNVRAGMVAAFAKVGARLAGDVLITETTLSGRTSQGVLCSAAELGLGTSHDGIMEFPAETKLGTPLASLIPATDTLIEFDNKSLTHRPDLWGHYGFAREFAAVFARPLKPLPRHSVAEYDSLPAYPLEVADTDGCPCYGCIEFEANITTPSPITMQARLHTLGQRAYNLGVDVTNYVSLELGQPTHAFDAQLIGAIRVAAMGQSEKFVTLDGQERELVADDLIIFGSVNGKLKPVAIAGIKGGRETEVTGNTKSILLESANFRAARIRRTSTRLDLRTDASQRYEKSQPPVNVRVATERILHLLRETIPVRVTSRFTVAGNLGETPRTIHLAPGLLAKKSGIELSDARAQEILSSLGFSQNKNADGSLDVIVPPFRSVKDIAIDVDIVEEVLRVYGYDNIEPVMPKMPLSPLHIEQSIKWEHKSRRLFTGVHRFIEVHSYCWFNDNWLKKLGFDAGETMVVKNPSTPWESRLRTTLVPTLLSLVDKNRPHRDAFRLLEYGHVFCPSGTKCDEQQRVAGVSYQVDGSPQEHFQSIKTAIQELATMLGARFDFRESDATRSPWQTPFHWGEIVFDGAVVGSLGTLDEKMLSVVSRGRSVIWFELDAKIFDRPFFPRGTFAEPPHFPSSWQDVSILWRVADGYAALEKILNEFTHPLLVSREFVTVYQGKGLEDGMASYSFRFAIAAADHTLTGDEIENFHQTFLAFLKERNLSLRG
ncbi:MAG: phenylalanine--tRNA ligase subunit beta [Thermoguttaceae bacterium]